MVPARMRALRPIRNIIARMRHDGLADIAVLSEPDGEELWNESEAYEALTGPARGPDRIRDVRVTDPRARRLCHRRSQGGEGSLVGFF